jgi:hypothetical protein
MVQRKTRPLIIGIDGAGKSYLLSTFPKPLWVFLFDPPDKAHVYLDRGEPGEVQGGKYSYYQEVFSRKSGDPIIRIEYFGETNPEKAESYMRFFGRASTIPADLVANSVATAGLDSITHFDIATRMNSQSMINKVNKDGSPMKLSDWANHNYSRHAIEQFVMTTWPNLIMVNAVVIGHPGEFVKTEDESGEGIQVVRTVDLPGNLGSKIGTSFSEVWRVYIDDQGVRRLQTQRRPKNPYACKTGLGIPDGIEAHYRAIFEDNTAVDTAAENQVG